MRNRLISLFLILAFISGCSMAPDYKKPEASIKTTWPEGESYKKSEGDIKASKITWKDYFKSEVMKEIIEKSLKNNLNLKVALLNIEKVQAAYRIQKSANLPEISGSISHARSGVPLDASYTGSAYTSTSLSASVNLSYELDFWGRIKSLNKEALENYLATEEAFKNTRIALIAETANSYITYLTYKKLLGLANETYDAQKKSYDLIKMQFKNGAATKLTLTQASTSVHAAEVSISQYTRLLAQAENALVLLCGDSVSTLLEKDETIDSISFLDSLPEGIPSDILLARPDLRRAEHLLKAANANIGAAKAAFYPTISLTGAFGGSSDSLSGLFKSGGHYAWNITPSLYLPIFNHGRLSASLKVSEVNMKIAATQYVDAIRTAFREVADQLAARGTYKKQLESQMALVDATEKAYELSKARYNNGVDSFLNVLDSQRALFSSRQVAAQTKQAYLTNLVMMYKVLGGGQL